MNFFIKLVLGCVAIGYGFYFTSGWLHAKKEWQALNSHLPIHDTSENRVLRKGIAKHFFYTDERGRTQLNIQARDSELIVHVNNHGILLQEEIEGVVGSYWDPLKDKAYTLFMPHALFDYPKKTFTGLQGQLEEFRATDSKLLGKGTFGEVECVWKGEPVVHLRKIYALHDLKIECDEAVIGKEMALFYDNVFVSCPNPSVQIRSRRAEVPASGKTVLFQDEVVVLSDTYSCTSDSLRMEEGCLTLEGKIVVDCGKASCTTQGPLVIAFDPETFAFTSLHTVGKSLLTFSDYVLQVDGMVHYEGDIISLKTPDQRGIQFRYPMGEIRACRGEIRLDKYTLSQIDLLGNVFASYGVPAFQYLIADGVNVLPQENLATLFSQSSGRVLLYDKINKVEMSADGVKVHWGEKSGDERIEGIGDVRFSFDQKERGIIDALFRSR